MVDVRTARRRQWRDRVISHSSTRFVAFTSLDAIGQNRFPSGFRAGNFPMFDLRQRLPTTHHRRGDGVIPHS
jgi:hypothetical protein